MPVLHHRLPPQAPPVQDQLDRLAIAVDPDRHRLLRAPRPVPVREQVQHRLSAPPRAVVMIIVLRKAAQVHLTEVRDILRPAFERCRLTAIVKPSPHEPAAQERPRVVETPPGLRGRRPFRKLAIVGRHEAGFVVARIFAARHHRAARLGADHRHVGVRGMIRIDRVEVVIAPHHIEHPRRPLAELAVERLRHRPRPVEFVDRALHRLGDPRAGLGAAVDFLVADAPQDDARMIAPLPHHPFELAQPLGIARHLPRFVDHQDAHPIARIEDCGRRRMMRRAIGVAAHRLQPFEPPDVQAVRHREADAGVVLMVAGALDLDRLAVEEKAVVRIEADRADAECARVAIDDRAIDQDLADQRVEVRRFRRPKCRRGDARFLHCSRLAPSRQRERVREQHHAFPVRTNDRRPHPRFACGTVIHDLGRDPNHRAAGVDRAPHRRAPPPDVHRRGLNQPHVAV